MIVPSNCYWASHALFTALGGRRAGLTPITLEHEGRKHWYLRWEPVPGEAYFLDPTAGQFESRVPWEQGVETRFWSEVAR